jgi:hypothetical protein
MKANLCDPFGPQSAGRVATPYDCGCIKEGILHLEQCVRVVQPQRNSMLPGPQRIDLVDIAPTRSGGWMLSGGFRREVRLLSETGLSYPTLIQLPSACSLLVRDDILYLATDRAIERHRVCGTHTEWLQSTSTHERTLNMPEGLALAGAALFVSDSGNDRVVAYDATSLGFARTFGGQGSRDGEFRCPQGLSADAGGREGGLLFVADRNNHRVQAFTLDGAWVCTFGRWGAAPGQFKSPRGVEVVRAGVVVSEKYWVQLLTLEGGPRQLLEPRVARALGNIQRDESGTRLYLADLSACAVIVLRCG